MLTILFFVLFFMVFGKLVGFAFKATWGIMKVMFYIIFMPIILLALFMTGFVYIALPVLVIIGLVSLFKSAEIA